MSQHVIYLSIPALRGCDIDAEKTPTLHGWAQRGAVADLTPTFPCVTSSVQATTWTGLGPSEHGVIANGFYDRDRREVEFWVARNGVIAGEQIWDVVARSGMTSAVWHAQNIKDASADYIVTPEPIHHPDGRTELWCYSKPDGLYQELVDDLDHFPLQHYWGPMANIESTRWIVSAAMWLIERRNPNFHYVYLPHLDYASQKFGPNSEQAGDALRELDAELARLATFLNSSSAGSETVVLAASEYAITDVSGVVYPNRVLADAGMLSTHNTEDGRVIDFASSRAFAMVDHQLAHVYTRDVDSSDVADVFAGVQGVSAVATGADRSQWNLDHSRAGDVILISENDHWFAYYWWSDDADAPPFARTVDIHRKPGYDPVELFFDPATRSIPLDATLVRGSHGASVDTPEQLGGIVCSRATSSFQDGGNYRDAEMKRLVLDLLGINRG
jgi:predicted AlkP superfamily pyrophosphatase or phosphodiesterase